VADAVERRRAFLAERRASSAQRYDAQYSAHYDQEWGEIGPTHAAFVERLAALVPPGGEVLDAACGTGKYWPALLGAGLRVLGVDQSEGMLARAAAKHPNVATVLLGLQDLADAADLRTRFDAAICVDALENVGPEDWPGVAAGLAGTLRPGAPLYVTVERATEPAAEPVDDRQVPGEDFDGVGYHYYPPRAAVLGWLAGAWLIVDDEADSQWYWHLLLHRTDAPPAG
jgi:SAM-dependent methyltransferase